MRMTRQILRKEWSVVRVLMQIVKWTCETDHVKMIFMPSNS